MEEPWLLWCKVAVCTPGMVVGQKQCEIRVFLPKSALSSDTATHTLPTERTFLQTVSPLRTFLPSDHCQCSLPAQSLSSSFLTLFSSLQVFFNAPHMPVPYVWLLCGYIHTTARRMVPAYTGIYQMRCTACKRLLLKMD